jgi:hypothetical protein
VRVSPPAAAGAADSAAGAAAGVAAASEAGAAAGAAPVSAGLLHCVQAFRALIAGKPTRTLKLILIASRRDLIWLITDPFHDKKKNGTPLDATVLFFSYKAITQDRAAINSHFAVWALSSLNRPFELARFN